MEKDWRIGALKFLEPDINYWSVRYKTPYIRFDDMKQELTSHLYIKLNKFDPEGKATLRTWSATVMRFKCIDIWRVAEKEQRTKQRNQK